MSTRRDADEERHLGEARRPAIQRARSTRLVIVKTPSTSGRLLLCDVAGAGSRGAVGRSGAGSRTGPATLRGQVIRFDAERGFGFIERDDGGADVFVHITAIQRAELGALVVGDYVEFEIEAKGERRSAAELRRVERSLSSAAWRAGVR